MQSKQRHHKQATIRFRLGDAEQMKKESQRCCLFSCWTCVSIVQTNCCLLPCSCSLSKFVHVRFSQQFSQHVSISYGIESNVSYMSSSTHSTQCYLWAYSIYGNHILVFPVIRCANHGRNILKLILQHVTGWMDGIILIEAEYGRDNTRTCLKI